MNLQQILKEYNLNLSTNPKGTDKENYLSYVDHFYEKYFFKFKHREISLLEIGYRHGASLALWSRYFTHGHIFGIDNGSDSATGDSPETKPEDEWLNRRNITTILGDAYSRELSRSINSYFDIIIEDGLHSLSSQIKAINLYLPKLKKRVILLLRIF